MLLLLFIPHTRRQNVDDRYGVSRGGRTMTWKNVNVSIRGSKRTPEKNILQNVTGEALWHIWSIVQVYMHRPLHFTTPDIVTIYTVSTSVLVSSYVSSTVVKQRYYPFYLVEHPENRHRD